MECLELRIPPLPQFITVGHAEWKPGMQHFTRTFDVYDVLFVKSGALYMTEEGREFAVQAGHMLVLEPNRTHFGHLPSTETTEVYWVHFVHPAPVRRLPGDRISWPSVLRKGTDFDVSPSEQFMYIPKFARVELTPMTAVIDKLIELHQSFVLEHALQVHALLTELLILLQDAVHMREVSRPEVVCKLAMDYLLQLGSQPFRANEMEEALHFQFDYMTRCLKKYTGMTPLQYVHRLRIGKAKSLLENTSLSVQEIAEQTGFDSANYLIRLFRRTTGMTPGKYRERRHLQ
ncbi:AraC family transcriptional regulator [Paenibacillus sp. MBLB4367]|uniref:helix-turn-helix transcriptional regulator n=1 Tax=Paenibacillus sp. MBLB4367 TaxID=3384767 RepID=UPI00390837D2